MPSVEVGACPPCCGEVMPCTLDCDWPCSGMFATFIHLSGPEGCLDGESFPVECNPEKTFISGSTSVTGCGSGGAGGSGNGTLSASFFCSGAGALNMSAVYTDNVGSTNCACTALLSFAERECEGPSATFEFTWALCFPPVDCSDLDGSEYRVVLSL